MWVKLSMKWEKEANSDDLIDETDVKGWNQT